jgi:hypothetical protein
MACPTQPSPHPPALPGWLALALARPWTYVLMGLAILLLDLFTGPFLLFPILFVLPVSLSAWFYRQRWAYALAFLLPLGRSLIAVFVDAPSPLSYVVANALIRVAVLGFMAFLVGRTARQTRELREKVAGLVTICAWSRTVEYQGEWLSFEEYLKRRFNIDASHSISPSAARKVVEDFQREQRDT